jgi:hypothetical protein
MRAALFLTAFTVALVLPGGGAGTLDTSVPSISLTIKGALGANGWHIEDTTLIWTVTDPQGIRRTEGCDVWTQDVETTGTRRTCFAENTAGQTFEASYNIRLDKFAPTITRVTARRPDANGWFNHRIDFAPVAADSVSDTSCNPIPSYGGPNTRRLRIVVRCRDEAGHRVSAVRFLKYDETPPRRVRAVRSRPPDRYGWYSHRLRIRFVGRDGMSGLAACTSHVYRGPNTARAAVRGSCRDRAGNETFRTTWFRFSKPLLTPASGSLLSAPPLLDWVRVFNARRYNVQLWHDGRKLLSRWPRRSRLDLDRRWRYAGESRILRRGEEYTWYVWPRLRGGYGPLLGRSTFTFRRRAAE